MHYSGLAAKLVKSRQAAAHRDAQLAQLQQALAAAHMALLDAGLDCQQGGIQMAAAASAAASSQQQQPVAAVAGDDSATVTGNHTVLDGSGCALIASTAASTGGGAAARAAAADVMNVALASEESVVSCCSSRLAPASSTASLLGVSVNVAAAMEARDRAKQVHRLTALCADKQAKARGPERGTGRMGGGKMSHSTNPVLLPMGGARHGYAAALLACIGG